LERVPRSLEVRGERTAVVRISPTTSAAIDHDERDNEQVAGAET
jgi:hypothetical protein